jgi:hypothetical protein
MSVIKEILLNIKETKIPEETSVVTQHWQDQDWAGKKKICQSRNQFYILQFRRMKESNSSI